MCPLLKILQFSTIADQKKIGVMGADENSLNTVSERSHNLVKYFLSRVESSRFYNRPMKTTQKFVLDETSRTKKYEIY